MFPGGEAMTQGFESRQRPAEAYLASLNEAQRAAVEFGIERHAGLARPAPLLVIAGAGSGKTSTLAHRVAHLVANGVDPGSILLLTFSRRAAVEMTRRVDRIIGPGGQGSRGIVSASLHWSGTFHSVGARLLREYAGRIGLAAGFTIHDREDSADLLNLVRHELGYSGKDRRFPLKSTCLGIYSAVINTQAPMAEVLQAGYPWCAQWESELKHLFLRYVEAKQQQQVLDYDDLLLYWLQMVADPLLAREIGDRFSHVLIDEYQDTNRIQSAIVLAMKPDGRGLTVVGDDAQSIYAFRGATVRNILDFPAHFTPEARQITLDRNYRSTQPILDAANAVIALASDRYAKNLWTERLSSAKPRLVAIRDDADQAGFVVEQLLARREEGVRLKSQAVLFRTGHHSARLEIELTRRNIPFVKFGGLRFLEAAHVKDVLAVVRWAQNPRDRVSGFRAIQILPGVGPRTAGRILENIVAANPGCALLAEQAVPESARVAWGEFVPVVGAFGPAGPPWPEAFERVSAWYQEQMDRLYEDAAIRQQDIAQLTRIAATYPDQERFLTELTLDPPDATRDESGVPLLDEDYLILSTIHSAKGQEWKAVTVLNAVDGCLPSDMATGSPPEIEEERRLLYVAMTRARDCLDIMVPQRFYTSRQSSVGDRHVYATRTRFIPNALLMYFDQVSWPLPAEQASGSSEASRKAVDLAARMRAMWT